MPPADPPPGGPRARGRPPVLMVAALAVATVVVAAFVALALTPFGGWVQSLLGGTGVRWAEAYQALDAAETNLPRNARERERLLQAWAMVEDEPPAGLAG